MLRMDKAPDGQTEWVAMSQRPLLVKNAPIWWHPGGLGLALLESGDNLRTFVGKFSQFSVVIDDRGDFRATVSWRLKTLADAEQKLAGNFSGNIVLDVDTFAAAFGGKDLVHACSTWMIQKFGGNAARQGCFLRYGDYLNIPGAGSGMDGDPHLSLFLDAEIRDSLLSLLPQRILKF